jgi:hypothetical protein
LDNKEKILISKNVVDKVKAGLHTIRLTSKEKSIQKEAARLVKLLEDETNADSSSLEERILKKMKETKGTDPDMNANLYILHRKLVNGQIGEQQALELFEAYERTDKLNNGFY